MSPAELGLESRLLPPSQTLSTRSETGWPGLRSQDLRLLEVRPDLASGWGETRLFQGTPRPLLDENEGKLEVGGQGT